MKKRFSCSDGSTISVNWDVTYYAESMNMQLQEKSEVDPITQQIPGIVSIFQSNIILFFS